MGVDEHGVEGRQTADIEPPVVVPELKRPEMRMKEVYVTKMSPEDKTTYSKGDSPIKPQVLRPSQGHSFSPKNRGQNFQGILSR